ncbi:MAG: sulfatase-like hydrolase/transferase [Phycisphaeraceae bacterium]
MSEDAKRPNVLLICTDHLSELCTRPGGHPTVITPTLDQLARTGTRFSRAYSACPSCIPARRSLMTGQRAREHGDRVYRDGQPLPDVPTMAQCFRDAGYQAYAVGKLHVTPQRDRVGFDDVILEEQGRRIPGVIPDGMADDWELYLQDQGCAGQEYASGMCHNDFQARPWHLDEQHHAINWAAREMCRMIRRRDPRKPGFWYLSFSAPHPPLTPLQDYLDLYDDADIDLPVHGTWIDSLDDVPFELQARARRSAMNGASEREVRLARKAYYATITHIDHQIRLVLGYLREAGLIDNTIIVFTSDHGHMVGDHRMWLMTPFYEMSSHIPLIIVPAKDDPRHVVGRVDDRFAEFGDIMPTLLDLAGLPIPAHVTQRSLFSDDRRDYIYGEHGENEIAQRMIREGDYKLIYYPVGNQSQLFNVAEDPRELYDLAGDPAHVETLAGLQALLLENLYGSDESWLKDGELVGLPSREYEPRDERTLLGQRGLRYL